MSEKEKDTMIYNEICNIIQRKIDETCAMNEKLAEKMEGKVLTAKMLDKDINLMGYLEENGRWENNTINVDTFTCNFPTSQVLYLAQQFKRISGAPERMFKYEIDAAPVAEISVPKAAKNLVTCVGESFRLPMDHIHYDPNNGCFVASDGNILGAVKADAILHEELKYGVNIPANIFKGKIDTISVTKVSDSKVFANDVKCDTEHIYPKYERVVKKYAPNQMVLFDKKSWSNLQKNVKALMPFTDERYHKIQILGKNGEKTITLRAYNIDWSHDVKKTVEIPSPLKQDISITLNGKKLQKIKSATMMFVKHSTEAISFVDGNVFFMLMPACDETRPFEMTSCSENETINPLVLAGIKKMEKVVEKVEGTKAEKPKEEPKKYLPTVISKWNLKPISEYLPKPETEYRLKPQLCLPAPKVIEDAEVIELKTVNGIAEGDFVLFKTFSGEKIACKVMAFSKDEKKAKLNLKGWNKFTVPVSMIEPTEMTRNTMPTWMIAGQTITDGNFTAEITDIKRSKIYFDDGSEKTLRYVLMNCRPTKAVEIPIKKDRWAWLKKLVRRAAIF